jgi:hypothetical protein
MSINASVGTMIPTNVIEVGNEISTDQLNAITSASSPTGVNPFATQSWVQSQGYTTSSGLSQDQVYAIALTSNISSFTWSGSSWGGAIVAETPYFSTLKASTFKFRMNNTTDFTPSWSGTSFGLPSVSDDSSYTTTGSGESFTVIWNGSNGGVPVI